MAIIHHIGERWGRERDRERKKEGECVTAARHLFDISFVENGMTYTSSLHQHQDVAINHHLGERETEGWERDRQTERGGRQRERGRERECVTAARHLFNISFV